MEDNNQLSFPEEDEDLEALRLAALQSLKRKSNNDLQQFGSGLEKVSHFNGSPRGKSKRGKFVRPQQGRIPRNGQFNGWARNSNLIAVPMMTEEPSLSVVIRNTTEEIPKLILPQDRYCKLEKSPVKQESLTTKFDRYDNSESESESDEELPKSENDEKSDLKRSTSLEALMEELENEIQGVKPEEKPKPKPKKKRKISMTPTPPEIDNKPETKPVVLKENLKPEITEPQRPNFVVRQRKWVKPPPPRRNPSFLPPHVVHHPPPPPELIPPVVAFAPPPPVQTFPFAPMGFDGGYVPPTVFDAPPPPLPPMHIAPPTVYERPLSPLVINTDAFSTSTLAPLSPRSAAFVMENRAIIEKRKRRSYSRSPSPARFRRSPKRLSLSPRLSKSPPKRRSLSPSPVRKVLPPRTASPKKPFSIHERLGLKPKNEDEEKKERPRPKEEKKEDPILEARRKKFERNEITMVEGVIRLKKQEEEEKKKEEERVGEEEEFDEDALLEGEADVEDDSLHLDTKMEELFSDSESDSDNEGRFKTKQETNQKVVVLPFAKLINGSKSEVKNDLKIEERKNERMRNEKRRFRGRSPLKKVRKNEKAKQTIGLGNERKIEIKIRNPAKYERVERSKEGEEKNGRKVEMTKKEEGEIEKEVVNEGAEEATSNISEGDLRAQLSRKRAERQKHPLPDVVPSRLLQNALQGVGFRKGKKSKGAKDESAEGKLPIHLRLGAANGSEVFGKKSRKHKNKGSQEQV